MFYNKFHGLFVLYDNNVMPAVKDVIPDFHKQYLEWFKKPMPIIKMKEQLIDSFSFSVASVLTDIAKCIMLFLANKLASDYASEFYATVISAINQFDTSHFEKVIRNCYLEKNISLRKRLPLEYKDLVLRILTYHNLLLHSNVFDENTFKAEYEKQAAIHAQSSFKEICSSLLTEGDMLFDSNSPNDKFDDMFIIGYIKDILCHSATFNINDITDYLNFKYAYKLCNYYFTYDKKSLKKYKKIFKNTAIESFLTITQKFIEQYK